MCLLSCLVLDNAVILLTYIQVGQQNYFTFFRSLRQSHIFM